MQDFLNQQDYLRRRNFPQSHFTIHVLRIPNCRRLPMYFPVMLPQKGPKESPTKNLHVQHFFSWFTFTWDKFSLNSKGHSGYKSYKGLPYETNTSGFYELVCDLRLPMTWKILEETTTSHLRHGKPHGLTKSFTPIRIPTLQRGSTLGSGGKGLGIRNTFWSSNLLYLDVPGS